MGSPPDQIMDLYERHADQYIADRARTRYNESIWLNRFAALLLPSGAVLDIGCGCGQPIAEQLIDQHFALDGVDSSPTLIARCREKFPRQKWLVADMRSLSLENRYSGFLRGHGKRQLQYCLRRRPQIEIGMDDIIGCRDMAVVTL